jgi:hypothetical protein
MAGHHAGDLPRTPWGAGEHLLRPMLPRHPAGALALDQHPCRPGGLAAPQPGRRPSGGPGLRSTLLRARHGQRRTIPSRQTRCRQATTPPADHGGTSTRCARLGAARHTEPLQGPARRGHPGGSAADTGGLSVRTPGCTGHRRPVRPDTWMHRTPDAWTLDVRSTGWTDVPTMGLGTRTGQRPAWPASGHPRDRRPPAGRPKPRPGHGAWERSATQDGSAVTAPTPRP